MVKILSLKSNHIPSIIDIANIELGYNYITNQQLYSIIDNTNSWVCKVAIVHSKVIGFVLCKKNEQSEFNSIIENYNDIIVNKTNNLQFGLIKTIVVEAGYKGQGIGTQLVTQCISLLKKQNVYSFYTLSWKSEKKDNSEKLFLKLGFTKLLEVPNYWKQDSLQNNYRCINCGNPPCTCSAILFVKH